MTDTTKTLARPITATLGSALLLGAAVALAPPALRAQDQNSAVDASGKPVGMAEEGVAGGPEIVGTDGMIRYADSDEMWRTISAKWNTLGARAGERWTELDEEALMQTGGEHDKLVSLVSEGYGISEEEAEREVTAWAASADDAM